MAREASLKRLKTDYIDLYWVHAWDFMTPVEEVMRGLDDTLAQVHGWSPFVGLQVQYSLAQREPERDLLPMARAFDIGVTAWSPLAGGILSGKYAKGTKANSETARYGSEGNPPDERKLRIGETVTQLANEIGRSASQVLCVKWRPKRTSSMTASMFRRLSSASGTCKHDRSRAPSRRTKVRAPLFLKANIFGKNSFHSLSDIYVSFSHPAALAPTPVGSPRLRPANISLQLGAGADSKLLASAWRVRRTILAKASDVFAFLRHITNCVP